MHKNDFVGDQKNIVGGGHTLVWINNKDLNEVWVLKGYTLKYCKHTLHNHTHPPMRVPPHVSAYTKTVYNTHTYRVQDQISKCYIMHYFKKNTIRPHSCHSVLVDSGYIKVTLACPAAWQQ